MKPPWKKRKKLDSYGVNFDGSLKVQAMQVKAISNSGIAKQSDGTFPLSLSMLIRSKNSHHKTFTINISLTFWTLPGSFLLKREENNFWSVDGP